MSLHSAPDTAIVQATSVCLSFYLIYEIKLQKYKYSHNYKHRQSFLDFFSKMLLKFTDF